MTITKTAPIAGTTLFTFFLQGCDNGSCPAADDASEARTQAEAWGYRAAILTADAGPAGLWLYSSLERSDL